MNYHFIRMNPTGAFSTLVDPSSKSRYVCFTDLETSKLFMDYLTLFRSKHGFWPAIDMSKTIDKVKSKVSFKQRTPEELMEYISIISCDYETVHDMARRSNSSFICVLSFDYNTDKYENTHSLRITGHEMDASVDLDSYKDMLDFTIKYA